MPEALHLCRAMSEIWNPNAKEANHALLLLAKGLAKSFSIEEGRREKREKREKKKKTLLNDRRKKLSGP